MFKSCSRFDTLEALQSFRRSTTYLSANTPCMGNISQSSRRTLKHLEFMDDGSLPTNTPPTALDQQETAYVSCSNEGVALCLPVCLSQAAARPACSRLGQCKLVPLVTGIVTNLQRRSEALEALLKETSERLETLQKGLSMGVEMGHGVQMQNQKFKRYKQPC
jgi:hypothetical protein